MAGDWSLTPNRPPNRRDRNTSIYGSLAPTPEEKSACSPSYL